MHRAPAVETTLKMRKTSTQNLKKMCVCRMLRCLNGQISLAYCKLTQFAMFHIPINTIKTLKYSYSNKTKKNFMSECPIQMISK